VAFGAGRFEDALAHFRGAFERSGRAELLFNIGSAAERIREDRAALEAYRQYLQRRPDAANRSFVEARIRFLERRREPPRDDAALGGAVAAGPEAGDRVDEGSGVPVWVWIVAAVTVAAGVAIAILLVTAEDTVEPPIGGDVPAVMTLRWP
jgi:hypothetical protein